jgi:hypothetical protein
MTKTRFNDKERFKLFAMQNLLLETDLRKLEDSGIEIGHLRTIQKDEIVDLEVFDHDIKKTARKMADFYVMYFCVENSIRRLIRERLEKYGPDWWDTKVPSGVQTEVAKKQKEEMDTTTTIRSDDPLYYVSFGEFISIFSSNWSDFQDVLRSEPAMRKTLVQFNLLRNSIAHSCELKDDEIDRFEMVIKDWLRIQSYL